MPLIAFDAFDDVIKQKMLTSVTKCAILDFYDHEEYVIDYLAELEYPEKGAMERIEDIINIIPSSIEVKVIYHSRQEKNRLPIMEIWIREIEIHGEMKIKWILCLLS